MSKRGSPLVTRKNPFPCLSCTAHGRGANRGGSDPPREGLNRLSRGEPSVAERSFHQLSTLLGIVDLSALPARASRLVSRRPSEAKRLVTRLGELLGRGTERNDEEERSAVLRNGDGSKEAGPRWDGLGKAKK